jgi:hypothetical protein
MDEAEARLLVVERALARLILAWRNNGEIPPYDVQALHYFLGNTRQTLGPIGSPLMIAS